MALYDDPAQKAGTKSSRKKSSEPPFDTRSGTEATRLLTIPEAALLPRKIKEKPEKTGKGSRPDSPAFPAVFLEEDSASLPLSWHWHEEFQLVILTKGSSRVLIGGDEAELRAGDGFFAGCGVILDQQPLSEDFRQHTIRFGGGVIGFHDPKTGAEDIFYRRYVLPMKSRETVPYRVFRKADPDEKAILDLIKAAWKSGAEQSEDYMVTVRECVTRVFVRLLKAAATESDSEREEAIRYHRQEDRIKKILPYLESNFTEDLSIGDLSVCAGISVSECLRSFRSILHTTPIQYLKQYRLARAAELLLDPEHARDSVSEIAFSVGFADMSYFTRAFRAQFRTTPSGWRKKEEICK